MKVFPLCFCSCFCFWLIFLCVSLPLSFKSLEQGKYALTLTWSTQQISDEVVTEPGMKMVGLGNLLLEYPSTFQTMYFVSDHSRRGISGGGAEIVRGPIRARTFDGLEMLLSVSFQWKLEARALQGLYAILGQDYYEDEFVRFAKSALVRSAANFGAYSYFTNRTAITASMLEMLQSEFSRPDRSLEVDINGMQLREVDLPDDFDAEIALTQEQMQEIEIADAEREEQRIAMQRELLVAEQQVLEVLENARALAESTLLDNAARVEQILVLAREQALANAEILRVFAESSGSDEDPYQRLFELMEIRAVNDHSQGKLMVNL